MDMCLCGLQMCNLSAQTSRYFNKLFKIILCTKVSCNYYYFFPSLFYNDIFKSLFFTHRLEFNFSYTQIKFIYKTSDPNVMFVNTEIIKQPTTHTHTHTWLSLEGTFHVVGVRFVFVRWFVNVGQDPHHGVRMGWWELMTAGLNPIRFRKWNFDPLARYKNVWLDPLKRYFGTYMMDIVYVNLEAESDRFWTFISALQTSSHKKLNSSRIENVFLYLLLQNKYFT